MRADFNRGESTEWLGHNLKNAEHMDMQNPPTSPESVAFALLLLTLMEEKTRGTNLPTAAEMLDRYALCLAAVLGERDVSHGRGSLH